MPFDNANYQPDDEVLNALIKLRSYHSNPSRWCSTGAWDADGYCIAGAIGVVCFNEAKRLFPLLIAALPPEARALGDAGIIHFNEKMGTTHAELLAMYDRAIAARRAALVSA